MRNIPFKPAILLLPIPPSDHLRSGLFSHMNCHYSAFCINYVLSIDLLVS